MSFWLKFTVFMASYFLVAFVTWKIHTWYDGYNESKTEAEIIDERVVEEKNSNTDAAKTENKIVADQQVQTEQNQKLEKDIEKQKTGFDCVIPAVGVRDLQQAVTSHTRAR